MNFWYFFFFSTLFIGAKQCTQSVSLSYKNCQISYDTCQDGQKFKSCTQEQCGYHYYDSYGNWQCQFYINVTISQKNCFSTCCRDDVDKKNYFSLQTLNQCVQSEQASEALLIGIICLIFGLCFFLAVLCICCAKNEKCTNKCDKCFSKLGKCCDKICFILTCGYLKNGSEEDNECDKKIEKISDSEARIQFNDYQWKRDSAPCEEIQNPLNLCTICLSGSADTMTNCGHFFHLECLVKWVKRKQKCPLCMGTKFNPVKLYCLRCCRNYNTLVIEKSSRYDRIIEIIKGPDCLYCR